MRRTKAPEPSSTAGQTRRTVGTDAVGDAWTPAEHLHRPTGVSCDRIVSVKPYALVALLFLTATASYLCRVNISVVGALMMRELGFSQVDMGRLFSAFVLGYALFQIPSGALSDRWGARRVLVWAVSWWVVATLLMSALGSIRLTTAASEGFIALLVLRFLLGIGEAPTFPAAAQGISRWIHPANQGLANGVVMAAIGGGSAIAPALLSRVMVHWGWRFALMVSALPAFVAAVSWAFVRNTETVASVAENPTVVRDGRSPLRSRSFAFLVLSYTLEGYVGYIFVFWFYLYLVQVRHFDLIRAGWLSSLPWLLSMISIPLGGVVSDRLIAGRAGALWGRRTVPIFGLTFSAVFLVFGARAQYAYTAVACLTLATALVLCVEGPFWAAMMELAGPRSGTGGGVMNCGSNVGGMISPVLTPVLAVHIGWENALYVAAGVALVAAALWLGISPQPTDLQPA
ncbi:MAG TPA: MFS transporter [Candidatus Dormibacteraeota bacterium]|nr:MFS transporter [Candidatus Dormibacteraeota bacterium]